MSITDKIKEWTEGVPVEHSARQQLYQTASLNIVTPHIAVMPDVHYGRGSTVGSVIPTVGAIIPAAVGVDIGCGMMAVMLSIKGQDLPDDLPRFRSEIEQAIPLGMSCHGESVVSDNVWSHMRLRLDNILKKHPKLKDGKDPALHVGTLGGGNHFIEVCLDTQDNVWVMLHSGSRNVGNRIGTYFIEKAKSHMDMLGVKLPNRDLAYLTQGTQEFEDYVEALQWAQDYARLNRDVMMDLTLKALRKVPRMPRFKVTELAVNCHHNYVSIEHHYGQDLYVTRKGAVKAGVGDLGIIPGSMGAKSFIVRGKGNPESFCSCSHGAGRTMSRSEAKRSFTLKDHRTATQGVECRKDKDVIDETPQAYKDIDAVMTAQSDLVEVLYTLKQIVCVKG
jgi:tRNA-splicing ligase RtcB